MDKTFSGPPPPSQAHSPVESSSEPVDGYPKSHHSTQPSKSSIMVEPTGPQRKPRKLVLCFDGTGNKFRGDDSDSSILKIYRMLDRTADDQYHYYQPGIGTYVVSSQLGRKSMRQRFNSWYAKTKDSMIGSSFDQHVVGGYRFLMRFYAVGDEIYIFGFSRGAYIARFLAEMLDYVGLLSHGNEEMVTFAWKAFSQWQCRRTDSSPEGVEKRRRMYRFLKGFRETFSRPVRRIRFLGLFDTVNSVPRFETAWMQRSKFPYTARSSAKVIRHAVSIDERRAKFRQDLMYQSNEAKKHHHHHHQSVHDQARQKLHDVKDKYRGNSSATGRADAAAAQGGRNRLAVPGNDEPARYRGRSRSTRAERSCSRASKRTGDETASEAPGPPTNYAASEASDEDEQDIDEVWFAGGHGDVGGGWEVPPDGKSASHVPLVWMVREAMRAGLSFDMEKVVALGCADECEEDAAGARLMPDHDGNEETANHRPVDVPGITVRSPSGSLPTVLNKSVAGQDDTPADHPYSFHHLLRKAHMAPIHDSLSYGGGLSPASVLAWKIMEYLPFRRMDLRSDGSWKPIRWPLPCGEVRDIPADARVHGSVIRRMKEDEGYRPGNLIVGGGGRGVRRAPKEAGIGEWVCVAGEGDVVGEVWVKKGVEGGRGEGKEGGGE